MSPLLAIYTLRLSLILAVRCYMVRSVARMNFVVRLRSSTSQIAYSGHYSYRVENFMTPDTREVHTFPTPPRLMFLY